MIIKRKIEFPTQDEAVEYARENSIPLNKVYQLGKENWVVEVDMNRDNKSSVSQKSHNRNRNVKSTRLHKLKTYSGNAYVIKYNNLYYTGKKPSHSSRIDDAIIYLDKSEASNKLKFMKEGNIVVPIRFISGVLAK